MDWPGLLITLGIGLALAWLLVVVSTAWQLTHPPRRGSTWALAKGVAATPDEFVLPDGSHLRYTTWHFRSTKGRGDFEVWDIHGADPHGPTVVFTHGWGDSRTSSLPRVPPLLPHARRILLWDLAAHGDQPFDRAQPTPRMSSVGTHDVDDLMDLLAVMTQTGRANTTPENRAETSRDAMVLAGFSLGAGVSIAAGARCDSSVPLVGVIAEAPYCLPQTPARNVMHLRGMPHRFTLGPAIRLIGLMLRQPGDWMKPGGPFDRAALARKLRCPLLVIHSADDEVCPVRDGQAIAASVSGSAIVVVHGALHTDVWREPATSQQAAAALGEFMRGLSHARPEHPPM